MKLPAIKCMSDKTILNPIVKLGIATGPINESSKKRPPTNVKILAGLSAFFAIPQRTKAATIPGNIELITTGTNRRGVPFGNKTASLIIPKPLEIKYKIEFIAAATNPAVIPDFNKF